MEFKQISLADTELKFATSGGISTCSGYASRFGGVDSYGDTIHPGAYSKVAGELTEVKMYFNHGWLKGEIPIGKMFVVEDANGLYVERTEFTKGIKLADDVTLALAHKTVNGLSVGIKLDKSGYAWKADGIGRDIYKVDMLKEVSVVDWPADSAALVTAVKSALESAQSLKEIESLLRDAGGFSRADACALVARIKSLGQSDSAPEKKASFAQLLALNAAVATLS